MGAADIGGTVYELEDGQRVWPYHYHHGVEEWLLVIDGHADPARARRRADRWRPGDVVCFPSGEAGAHEVRGPGRFLLVSAAQPTSVGGLSRTAARSAPGRRPEDDRLDFRRADAVGYWDGER